MGGPGSGVYYRLNKKPTTNGVIRIDIRKLTLKWFSPKQVLSKTWIGGEAEKCHVCVEQEGEDLRIKWVREFPGLAPKKREMQVRVVYTPLNFGGERPWFLCPNKLCGRRVAKLYLGAKGFFCCKCSQLAYPSQQGAPEDRAFEEIDKIQVWLGLANGTAFDPLPPRPKRMRTRTYALLAEKLRKNQERVERAALRLLSRSEAIGNRKNHA